MTPEEELRLRAEAELELENEMAGASAAPQREARPPSEPSLMGSIGKGVQNFASHTWDGIKAIPDLIGAGIEAEAGNRTGVPGAGIGMAIGNHMVENPETILPNIATAGSAALGIGSGGLAGAASYPTFQFLAREGNKLLGLQPEMTGSQEVTQFTEDLVGSATMPVGENAMKGMKTIFPSANKFLPWGTREENSLKKLSFREDAVTDALGGTKGTTNSAVAYGDKVAKYEDNFVNKSGLMDLDPNDPNALRQLGGNLDEMTTAGKAQKNAILQQADEVAPGIDLESIEATIIPETNQTLGEFLKGKSQMAYDTMKGAFSRNATRSGEPTSGLLKAPKEAVNASGLSNAIADIDNEIRTVGGFDVNNAVASGRNPSQVANELSSLKAARKAMADALDNHIATNLGEEYLTALKQGNADVATGLRYGDLVNTTRGETGQALAPNQPRGLTNAVTNIPTDTRSALTAGINKLFGRDELTQAASREGDAITRAQSIVNYRNGAEVPPSGFNNFASKVVDPIVTYGTLGAGAARVVEQNLPAKEARATPTPLSVNLNPPTPEPKGGFQLPRNISQVDDQGIANLIAGSFPPQMSQPLLLQFKQVAGSGDKKKVAEFLGEVTRQFPDFPIQRGAVTGMASEFDIGDGKVRLFSHQDKLDWENQINNSSLETDEKAQRVLSLRKDGVVVPFNVKVNEWNNPAEPTPEPGDRALQYMMQDYQFSARGANGRRIEK